MARRCVTLFAGLVLMGVLLVSGEDKLGDTILHEEFKDGPAEMAKSFAAQGLAWFNEPTTWTSGHKEGKGLEIFMENSTDFWRKSYYDPPFEHDNGHLLYFPTFENVVVTTEFSLKGNLNQFDHGGLMLRVNSEHWIKMGMEYADNKRRLGAVVTNDFSQWSVQEWDFDPISIRLFRINDEVVGEVFHPEKKEWVFFFVGHVGNAKGEPVKVGLFSASPLKQGATAVFSFLKIQRCPKERQCHSHYNGPPEEPKEEL